MAELTVLLIMIQKRLGTMNYEIILNIKIKLSNKNISAIFFLCEGL